MKKFITITLFVTLTHILYSQTAGENKGPFNASQMNNTCYVVPFNGQATIQKATNSCQAIGVNSTVIVGVGSTPADTIGAVTGVTSGTTLVDQRALPWTCYHYSTGSFAATPCVSGTGVTTTQGTSPITVNGDNSPHTGSVTVACVDCVIGASTLTGSGTALIDTTSKTAGPSDIVITNTMDDSIGPLDGGNLSFCATNACSGISMSAAVAMNSNKITGLANGSASDDAAAFGQLGTKQINTVSSPLTFTTGTLAIPPATTSANGYLTSTDWNTFNGKLSSVTFDQIGSGTNLGHGLVCGAGCVISAIGGGFNNANELNGTLLSGLATGLLTNTTSTGVPTITAAPSGAIVGTTDTQTLTNKSISASQVNSGTLALANGGTGATGFTVHGVMVGQTSGALTVTSAGATNSVFIGQGASSDPIFSATPAINCTNCTNVPATTSLAFSGLTTATNTTATMTCGTGCAITTSGSGTNTATAVPAANLTGSTLSSGVTASSLTSLGTLTALNVSTATATTGSAGNFAYTGSASSIPLQETCGSLTNGNFCGLGFGFSAAAGNGVQLLWSHTGTNTGFGLLATNSATMPIQLAGTLITTTGPLAVNNSGTGAGFTCNTGIVLCANPSSNTVAPFTVSTTGAVTALSISINGGTAITAQSGTGGTVAMTASPTFTGTAVHANITATGTTTLGSTGQTIIQSTGAISTSSSYTQSGSSINAFTGEVDFGSTGQSLINGSGVATLATNSSAHTDSPGTGGTHIATNAYADAAVAAALSSHNDYADIQGTLFTQNTMLGPVFYEPVSVAAKVLIVRQSGTISCTVAPAITLIDLGTSATTAYPGTGSVISLTTGTSTGAYTTTPGSVNMTAGHYYGYAFTAGTCVTAPAFDITTTVQ